MSGGGAAGAPLRSRPLRRRWWRAGPAAVHAAGMAFVMVRLAAATAASIVRLAWGHCNIVVRYRYGPAKRPLVAQLLRGRGAWLIAGGGGPAIFSGPIGGLVLWARDAVPISGSRAHASRTVVRRCRGRLDRRDRACERPADPASSLRAVPRTRTVAGPAPQQTRPRERTGASTRVPRERQGSRRQGHLPYSLLPRTTRSTTRDAVSLGTVQYCRVSARRTTCFPCSTGL